MTYPVNPSNDNTPDADADIAFDLLTRAGKMLEALNVYGFHCITDPMDLLALQLLGPVLARVIGDDPARSQFTVLELAKAVDLTIVRTLLETQPK